MKGLTKRAVSVLVAATILATGTARAGAETRKTVATFDAGTGEKAKRIEFETGKKNRFPKAPRKPGHLFMFWVLNDGKRTKTFRASETMSDEFVAGIGNGKTFKASWTKVKPVVVEFDLAGGSGNVPTQKFVYDAKRRNVRGRVSKRGARFAGWTTPNSHGKPLVVRRNGKIPNRFILENAGRKVVLRAAWTPTERKKRNADEKTTVIVAETTASDNAAKASRGGGFEITFFAGPDSTAVTNRPIFADLMKDAGFTVAQLCVRETIPAQRWAAERAVDEIAKRGLRIRLIADVAFVVRPDRKSVMKRPSEPNVFPSKYAASVASKLAKRKEVLGFFIADEPRPFDVGLASKLLEDVSKVSGKSAEANLFSNYATTKWRGKRFSDAEYERYVDDWAKSAPSSKWLSAANYPSRKGNFSKKELKAFFENVVVLGETAERRGKKPVLITGSYDARGKALGKKELAFQMAACLVLGMKALDWYTFRPPGDGDETVSGWLVGNDARPTRTYAAARTTNAWAYSIGSELFPARLSSAYEMGTKDSRKLRGNGDAAKGVEVESGRILSSTFRLGKSEIRAFSGATPKKGARIRMKGLSKVKAFSPLQGGGKWIDVPSGKLRVLDGDGDLLFETNSGSSEIEIPRGGIVLVKTTG